MRFNDLTQTILAVEDRTGLAATTLWRQCIDMLAQYDQPGKVRLEQEDRVALVSRLNDLRGALDEGQRIASVVELGNRLRSPALVEFFASDRPSVCAVAMARAQLPDVIWPVLLSRVGPTARGVLRGRRDIGARTRRALEAFGPVDLVLAPPRQAEGVLSPRQSAIGTIAADTIEYDEKTAEKAAAVAASAPPLSLVQGEPGDEAVLPPTKQGEDSAEGVEAPISKDERSQIRQLVERIERYTSTPRTRSITDLSDLGTAGDDAPVLDVPNHFPFETDVEGQLIWVGDASRTALVGLSLAQPASPGETGPDGHIAGAFARRTSFQKGRLFIGEGAYSGEWRLSALPFFDPATGRFRGYRGQARRPMAHELPQPVRSVIQPAPQTPSLDSMRQIVHELRTPLNAILGFAEIIEQQLFGPADVHYREMAANILTDARRLMTVFDDIDLAARSAAVDKAALRPCTDSVDVGRMMGNVVAFYNDDNAEGGKEEGATPPRLSLSASAGLPFARIEAIQAERMLQHLVRTLVSVAEEGEVVRSALWFQPDRQAGCLVAAFDRPRRLAGLSEKEILDPGYGTDGDWPDGPLLGLGFSMRLVRSLVQGQGGALVIDKDRFLLELPVARDAANNEAG